MPVKWTPDNDQMLLLKILETHSDLSVDAKKISAAWPADRDKPTARAITERLVKIRSLAKANGAGHFNIASSQSKGKASGPSTPRKPRVVADGGSKDASTPTSGGGSKRKRAGPKAATVEDVNDDDDDDDDEESFGGGMKVSSHEAAWLQSDVSADAYPTPSGDKELGNGGLRCEDVGEEGSPSKKARRGGVVKVEKYASDGEGDGESSVGEFADADAV